jgi:hypothetical protein
MMKFIIKDKNRIEYQTRHGICKGTYVIKNISITMTAKNPEHVRILQMHRYLIEKEIIDYLNHKSYRKLKDRINYYVCHNRYY